MSVNKKIAFTFGALVFIFSWRVAEAQQCSDIFPDAVSNSNSSGEIIFGNNSQVIGSPDGILDTRNLSDSSGGVSCDGSPCLSSNAIVEESDFNSFPNNQPDISVGFQQSQTISPGNYDGLTLSSEATLNMEPGVYAFREDIVIGFQSEVVITEPGTVVIYARRDVDINTESAVNERGGARSMFLFAREDITFNARSVFNGVVFSRQDIEIFNGAVITGAVTARQGLNLRSASTVTYDQSTVAGTDFDDFCTPSPVTIPSAYAEWLFDEGTGQSAADTAGSLDAALGSNITSADSADPEWVCGQSGFALEFGGSQYATTQGNLDPPENGSVVFWFRTAGVPGGTTRPFSHSDGWELRYDSSGRIFFDINRPGANTTFATNTILNDTEKWYHVAVVYSAEFDDYSIYIDGALDNSADIELTAQSAQPLNFGRRTWGADENFVGALDDMRIYDQELSQAQVQALISLTPAPCALPNPIDHFNFDFGSSSASVCEAKSITISARDASDDLIEDYLGTVTISTSTSHGDWSANVVQGTLTPSASDSGLASYEFNQSELDQGEITLDLSNTRAETLTVTVSDTAAGVSSTSDPITFSELAFVISENDNLDNDVIAGRPHQFIATLLEQAPAGFDGGACSVATNYSETTVKAWISRSANDPNGNVPVMVNSAKDDNVALADSELTAQQIDLNFNLGIAQFSLETSDVGEYSIELFDDALNFSDQAIRGGSETYTVRPFAFLVSATGNNSASSATGPVFTTAGDTFSVQVETRGWSANDDLNDDGIPDVMADTNVSNNENLNGAILPSFGLETTPEFVSLNAELVAPSGGNNPGLSGVNTVTSFSGGVGDASGIYYEEVGIIQITAAIDGNYLGASTSETQNANSASTFVGRFIPSYFELSAATFANACGTFNYLEQPRDLTLNLEAFNSRDQRTQNYLGDFAKLDGSTGSQFSFGAIDAALPTALSSRVSTANENYTWASGELSYSSEVAITRLAVSPFLEAPFQELSIGLFAQDSDGVSVQSSALNLDVDDDASDDHILLDESEYVFGRLSLPSQHGPESAELRASLTTQYWNGSAWVLSENDDCTAISTADISFPSGTIDVVANRSVLVGGGTSTVDFGIPISSEVVFSSGDARMVFSAPGAGNTGSISVDIDLSDYSWLQFDWEQNSNYSLDQLPTAEFSFGSYRGHDRIIFWQEVLNN